MTPWTAACQASLSITNSQRLLKLKSIESVMPSSHLILCHALLLLPSISPSIRVFSNESALRIRWPKYWSCSFGNLCTIGYKIIEKVNHNKQAVFKPLLVICWLISPWPKQVTCPSLKSRSRETLLFEKRSMKDFVVIKKKKKKNLNSSYYRTSLVVQVVETPYFPCRGHRFGPWLGN